MFAVAFPTIDVFIPLMWQIARQQLEAAVRAALQEDALPPHELASYRLKLAQAYWALGGELKRGRGGDSSGSGESGGGSCAHSCLLSSAAVEGPHQGEAFCWLGRWFDEVAADGPRAIKCYQRAIALNPNQVDPYVSSDIWGQ